MRGFNGMEIQPYNHLSNFPTVKIDRTRVEGFRSLFGKDSFSVVGQLGTGGEGFPVSRAFDTFGEAWDMKQEIDTRIRAARIEQLYGGKKDAEAKLQGGLEPPERAV